jgi:ABC-type sugar transport system permease subunit
MTIAVAPRRDAGGRWRELRAELRRPQVWIAYVFLAPAFLPLLLFVVLPVFAGVAMSFANFDPLAIERVNWVGWANYQELLQDFLFGVTIQNTFRFTVLFVPLNLAAGFATALLLNRQLRGIAFIRGAYYLPYLTSAVAIGIIWAWLFSPNAGLINTVLRVVGMATPDWLGHPSTALHAVTIVAVWKAYPGTMLIYLAGLQGIPQVYYDAALVDGAGRWELLRDITWPLLRPVTFYLVVIGVISSMQVFDLVNILTNGGPADSTTTIVHQIYLNAFRFGRMGYAAAMACLLFIGIALLTIVNWRLFSKDVEY